MRRWLLMILCCAIPLQGFAAVAWPGAARCPHAQGGMQGVAPDASMSVADSDAAIVLAAPVDADDDCCNGLASALHTGKACKHAGCELPSAWFLPAAAKPVPSQPGDAPAVAAAPAAPVPAPALIWRPPSAL